MKKYLLKPQTIQLRWIVEGADVANFHMVADHLKISCFSLRLDVLKYVLSSPKLKVGFSQVVGNVLTRDPFFPKSKINQSSVPVKNLCFRKNFKSMLERPEVLSLKGLGQSLTSQKLLSQHVFLLNSNKIPYMEQDLMVPGGRFLVLVSDPMEAHAAEQQCFLSTFASSYSK